MVLLVALGLWADGSGRRDILDGELVEGETQPDWQRLLDRRWQRGVRPEAGLQAVIRDGKGEQRTNRALRRKFRQACCFSSRRGALVAIYLQMQRLHVRWTKTSWAHTARSLSLAFY